MTCSFLELQYMLTINFFSIFRPSVHSPYTQSALLVHSLYAHHMLTYTPLHPYLNFYIQLAFRSRCFISTLKRNVPSIIFIPAKKLQFSQPKTRYEINYLRYRFRPNLIYIFNRCIPLDRKSRWFRSYFKVQWLFVFHLPFRLGAENIWFSGFFGSAENVNFTVWLYRPLISVHNLHTFMIFCPEPSTQHSTAAFIGKKHLTGEFEIPS
jgi:hypothetical protein